MPQAKRYDVRVERNFLIPLRDGVSLAADLYRPDTPGRFPALVSYSPITRTISLVRPLTIRAAILLSGAMPTSWLTSAAWATPVA